MQDHCNEFWHHSEPAQHARDGGYLSRAGVDAHGKISLDLLPSSGGLGTDDTTLSEVVEPSSFDAAGDRLLVHLNCSYSTACGGARTRERDTTSQKREAEKLDFDAWAAFRNFRIWQMNVRSEVSSCASRPIEAMVWISEMQSSKSIVELKTSYSTTGSKLQTNFEVLDS